MTLEADILDEAHRLGFAAAGIAAAGPCESTPAMTAWLTEGNAADMDFLQRQAPLRADPRNIMPEARSVIVVAARYPTNTAPGTGISTYCRGRDYHDVIRAKLKTLAAQLQKTATTATRICVDSAPLCEREWAVRAGIGWRGKQGQVINPEHGCCLLLGELLVSIPLTPSAPLKNQCGSCRLCLAACPTGAIRENGFTDCRKCISYMTIENRKEIPQAIEKAMGQTLFGCDFCTAACPWNSRASGDILPEFHPQPMPTARDIMQMDKTGFDQQFRGTAIHRTGLACLKRNAAIALRNQTPAA